MHLCAHLSCKEKIKLCQTGIHHLSAKAPVVLSPTTANNTNPIYLHLKSGADPADISEFSPYVAVVMAEDDVASEWRSTISRWLVDTGCMYMIAWGKECALWDDIVDWCHMEKYDFGNYPENSFLITCWFSDYTLEEVFEFAKVHVEHPTVELTYTVLLHISNQNDEAIFLKKYADA